MPVDTVESRPEESFLDFGVPVADWFDPQEMWHDPYPAYERMREMGPVVYAPAVKRVFMTRHESVTYAEQHPELFRSYSDRNVTMVRAMGGRPMLRKDDPEFKKLVDAEVTRIITKGEIYTIYKKWFESLIPPFQISPMYQKWAEIQTPPNQINLNLPMVYMLHDSFKVPTDWIPEF